MGAQIYQPLIKNSKNLPAPPSEASRSCLSRGSHDLPFRNAAFFKTSSCPGVRASMSRFLHNSMLSLDLPAAFPATSQQPIERENQRMTWANKGNKVLLFFQWFGQFFLGMSDIRE
jgi:hypothetical protein